MATHTLAGVVAARTGLHALLAWLRPGDTRAYPYIVVAGGTTSNEIVCGNDGLMGLDIPPNFTGSTVTIYGKARADQAAAKPVSRWAGGTKTALAITGVTVNDTLWFETPIAGLYSITLVVPAQATTVSIVPRWGRVLYG